MSSYKPKLNKAVCKCCIMEDKRIPKNDERGWGGHYEGMWVAFGVVVCPIKVRPNLHERHTEREWQHSIEELPPEWCPRKFEHLVFSGMSDE